MLLLEELIYEQLLPKQVLFQEKHGLLLEVLASDYLLPQQSHLQVLLQEKLLLLLEGAGWS